MAPFVDSPQFAALHVGLELDEGWASGPDVDTFPVFYAERVPWWFVVTARGEPAHGSKLVDGTAMSALQGALTRIAAFREGQFELVRNGTKQFGEVVSVNPVFLRSGVAADGAAPFGDAKFIMNMQPSTAEAGFDMRLPPMTQAQMDALEKTIHTEWAPESVNLSVTNLLQSKGKTRFDGSPAVTDLSGPNATHWWGALRTSLASLGFTPVPEVFPAATDAAYLRVRGIPSLGFSPLRRTKRLLHEHDEHIAVDQYAEAVQIYVRLIHDLAMSPRFDGEDDVASLGLRDELLKCTAIDHTK